VTNEEAAAIFAESHPEGDPQPECFEHYWAEWEFNYRGDAEYRLCARCGGMEQQWIGPEGSA